MKKRIYRICSVLLTFLMMAGLTVHALPASADTVDTWTNHISKPVKDGNNVYQIGTPEELAWFGALVNGGVYLGGVPVNPAAKGKLTADISLAGYYWNSINSFVGTFDGDNHTVSDMTFDPEVNNLAFFSSNGGTIKNLGITGADITGRTVAGIVSSNEGTVSHCFNTATMISEGGAIAGICTSNRDEGIIEFCYNTGTLYGLTGSCGYSAGICGTNQGIVRDCYNTGTMINMERKPGYCGNIVGNLNVGGTVERCYSFGMITVGFHPEVYMGDIGSWKETHTLTGGKQNEGTVTDCYHLKNIYLTGTMLDAVPLSDTFRSYPSYNESKDSYGFASFIVDSEYASLIDQAGTYYAYYDVTNDHIIALKLEGEGAGSNITIDAQNPGDVSFSGLTGEYMSRMTKQFYIINVPASTTSVTFINTEELQDCTFYLDEIRSTQLYSGNGDEALAQVQQTWPEAYPVISDILSHISEWNEPPISGDVRVIIENTTCPAGEGDPWWDGTLVDTWVEFEASSTMMDCIVAAADTVNATVTGAEYNYISAINGLGEFMGGGGSGWMGTLNDWFTNTGFGAVTASSGQLSDNDEIRVMYTCDLGVDLGGTWDNNYKTLNSVDISEGVLTPRFHKYSYNYILTVPEGTTAIKITPTATNKNFQVRTYLGTMEDGTEYKRTQMVPVIPGTFISIVCGYKDWPSMNNDAYSGNNAQATPHKTYVFMVEFGDPPEQPDPGVAWDVNDDECINVLDLVLAGNHFGETGNPGWIPEDVNNDGSINVLDLVIIGNHFGE